MIVATAGHIDHGKTLLVKALTGVDADRLPEEKKRGLTIDLGFAYTNLADGTSLGFIDVPGHERFVRNMLAGVTGIDFALLIVAADDGPMPQTREHLAILDLLGVTHGVVALTKIDRVDTDRRDAVAAEIAALLEPTGLAGAPVFAVSAITGDGIAALSDHLAAAAQAAGARPDGGNFRLAIDRSFSVAGAGVVVTGTVFAGTITVGDRLFLAGTGREVRVRGLHANNADAQSGRAGQRCAVNLAGGNIAATDIHRGDWLVADPAFAPIRRFDARLHVPANAARGFTHWTATHVHLGAADVTGRVAVLGAGAIAPGEAGLVRVLLDQPVGALYGDRFVLRDQSARETLAGGSVLDPWPPARGRSRPARLDLLGAMAEPDPASALTAMLAASPGGVDLTRFALARNLTEAEAAALFATVDMHSGGSGDARWALGREHWDALADAALSALDAYHARWPDRLGPDANAWRRSLERPPAAALFDAVADALVAGGAVARRNQILHRPTHAPVLNAADEKLWRDILAKLDGDPLRPPVVHEIARDIGATPETVAGVLRRAERLGRVVRIDTNRFYLPEGLEALGDCVRRAAAAGGEAGFAVTDFRDAAGIGRNLAVQVLEYFDRAGLTRRAENTRYLA
jgi:selenocysteine-specific elongation factor